MLPEAYRSYRNEYKYIPQHMRPEYKIYKNTTRFMKYGPGWRAAMGDLTRAKFLVYKNMFSAARPYSLNDRGEFKLFQAFQLWRLTNEVFIIESLLELKKIHGVWYILVKWRSYERPTYEPLKNVRSDAPKLVEAFLEGLGREV